MAELRPAAVTNFTHGHPAPIQFNDAGILAGASGRLYLRFYVSRIGETEVTNFAQRRLASATGHDDGETVMGLAVDGIYAFISSEFAILIQRWLGQPLKNGRL